jgi:hypothetical protein
LLTQTERRLTLAFFNNPNHKQGEKHLKARHNPADTVPVPLQIHTNPQGFFHMSIHRIGSFSGVKPQHKIHIIQAAIQLRVCETSRRGFPQLLDFVEKHHKIRLDAKTLYRILKEADFKKIISDNVQPVNSTA